jgi:hypothetical protein
MGGGVDKALGATDCRASTLGKDSIQFASESAGVKLRKISVSGRRMGQRWQTYRSATSFLASPVNDAGSWGAGVDNLDGGGLANAPLPAVFFCCRFLSYREM